MFASTNSIFSDVKIMLGSYDAAGLISDPDLYRWSREYISNLGTYALKSESVVLFVENHKVTLPENFSHVDAVYLCGIDEECQRATYKGYYGNPVTYTLKDWYSSTCVDKCDVCYDNNEYYVTRTFYKEFEVGQKKVDLKYPLKVNKKLTLAKCTDTCVNTCQPCGPESFDIIGNTLHTSFEDGSILVVYKGLPMDEDGYPEIIDEPIITAALEAFLIYKCFQKIFYNGDGDVQNRMTYAEQKYRELLKESLYFVKLPTWASLVEYSKERKKGLSLFNVQ